MKFMHIWKKTLIRIIMRMTHVTHLLMCYTYYKMKLRFGYWSATEKRT